MLAVEIKCLSCGVSRGVFRPSRQVWANFGPILGQFDSGRQLLQLPPVRGGADPFRVSRKQHLDAVAALVGDERGVHARHQAHGRVGVAGVVLPAFTDVQRLERRFEVADCNTWFVDPQPTFARLEHKGADRGRLKVGQRRDEVVSRRSHLSTEICI